MMHARAPFRLPSVVAILLVFPALAPAAIGTTAAPAGALRRIDAAGGCLTASATPGCARTAGLNGPRALAVTPDGLFAYAVADAASAVTAFRRDPATGGLTRLGGKEGCINLSGAADCKVGRAIEGARAIAISPDGKHVYVAAPGNDAVAVFSRSATTGFLTQLAGKFGCIANRGRDCTAARQLGNPVALAVSPDGKNVYVATRASNGVAVLSRNTGNGTLTQPGGKSGCITNGGSLGRCTNGHGMRNPSAIAVSGDGRVVVVSATGSGLDDADGSLARLERSATSGALTQSSSSAGCLSSEGSDGCRQLTSLGDATAMVVDSGFAYVASAPTDTVTAVDVGSIPLDLRSSCANPAGSQGCEAAPSLDDPVGLVATRFLATDGVGGVVRHVYVANLLKGRVVVLDGALRQLDDPRTATDRSGCVALQGDAFCVAATPLSAPVALGASPDARHVYVLSAGSDSITGFTRQFPPVCGGAAGLPAGAVAVPFETPAAIQAPCVSLDGDALQFTLVAPSAASGPLHGVVSPAASSTGLFTYQPADGFIGPDQFVVRASNGTDAALVGIQVAVQPVAGQPVCRLDVSLVELQKELEKKGGPTLPPGFVAEVGVPRAIAIACQDPDGDPLAVAVVRDPLLGEVQVGGFVDGRAALTYVAFPGTSGPDSFQVQASDGEHESNVVTVPVLVVPPADTTGPGGELAGNPKKVEKGLALTVGCPAAEATACTGFVTARFPGRRSLAPVGPALLAELEPWTPVIGVVPFAAPPGELVDVWIELSPADSRRLGAMGPPLVEIEIAARDGDGNTALVRTTRPVVLDGASAIPDRHRSAAIVTEP